MTQEPTLSDYIKALEEIRREQLEFEKCTQRTIQNLQSQIDECIKNTRSLKTEVQVLNDQLRKSQMSMSKI